MGISHSKHSRTATYRAYPSQSEKNRMDVTVSSELDASIEDFDLSMALKVSTAAKWEEKLLQDPKNRLALAALSRNSAQDILKNPEALLQDSHIFSDKIELEGSPVTNQRQSGRCWLFAATNVFRIGLMKKYKLAGFELSQSYFFFWDKFEKANFYLEQIIDTLDEPLDGRLVQRLMEAPVSDGGQWDMVVNLVEKYGFVPQEIYPDSFHAKSSGHINYLITAKLREAGLGLRKIGSSASPDNIISDELQKYKSKVMQDIYGVLVLTLGVPPKPSDTFTWTYTDKEQKFHSVTITPMDFYKENISAVSFKGPLSTEKGSVSDRFSLINDPRNDYMKLLTVERLGNVVGGRGITYVNVDMQTIKDVCIAMIKAQRPVFFGSDVGKFSDSSSGIMDPDLFDYELGYNFSLKMDKTQRLLTGESSMTHAMVLTGVNIVDGKPTKWRVENSWSETTGQKGYMVMTDKWMDEFCYQAVVDPQFVKKEILDVLNQKPKVLPLWDPMGSLA